MKKKYFLIFLFTFIMFVSNVAAKETITKTCQYDLDGMDQLKKFSATLEVYTSDKSDPYKNARVIKDGSKISVMNWVLNDSSGITSYEAQSSMISRQQCPKYLVYYGHKKFANDSMSEAVYAFDTEDEAINISSKLENKSKKEGDAEYSTLITYNDFDAEEKLKSVNLTCTYDLPEGEESGDNLVLKLKDGKWSSSNKLDVEIDPQEKCMENVYIDINSKKIVDKKPNTPGFDAPALKLTSNKPESDDKDKYNEVCGILTKNAQNFIYKILDWIKYIALILTVGLSILDFFKAVAAEEDDAFKKAAGRLAKRIIVVVLLFLLPVILEFVLKLVHIQGVNVDDPLCTK